MPINPFHLKPFPAVFDNLLLPCKPIGVFSLDNAGMDIGVFILRFPPAPCCAGVVGAEERPYEPYELDEASDPRDSKVGNLDFHCFDQPRLLPVPPLVPVFLPLCLRMHISVS